MFSYLAEERCLCRSSSGCPLLMERWRDNWRDSCRSSLITCIITMISFITYMITMISLIQLITCITPYNLVVLTKILSTPTKMIFC